MTAAPRLRVLFMAEAVTLAHVARPFALARDLPAAAYDVTFAAHPRFASLFPSAPWPVHAIDSIDAHAFRRALARGATVYDVATLERYVDEDRRLLRETKPDVVVGDFRLSLAISARREGVAYVNITNAYWSPYATPDWIAPDLPLTRVMGARATTWLFKRAQPHAFAWHARPFNVVRARNGLLPVPDIRFAYTDGDITLYADLPGLVPLTGAPLSHRLLGPIEWSPAVPLPSWWNELPDARSVIYVNLGNSGEKQALPRIIAAIDALGLPAIVATGADDPPRARGHVRFCRFIDGAQAARRALVVICNGGSPTSQQALRNGAPVIGLASNLDQFLNMTYVERNGLGLLRRAHEANASTIRAACEEVLSTSSFSRNASAMAASIAPDDANVRFRAALASAAERVVADDARRRAITPASSGSPS